MRNTKKLLAVAALILSNYVLTLLSKLHTQVNEGLGSGLGHLRTVSVLILHFLLFLIEH